MNITIGKHVFINTGATFQDQGGITIGNNVLIGHHATILTLNHGLTIATRHDYFFKPVIIEDDVWLGANVTILPGVTVGKGSVVGAGSIVTKNVPPHTVVVGSPPSCGQNH